MAFTLSDRHSVSINDPGVAVLPDELRSLRRGDASATASGGLPTAVVVQNLGATWSCVAASLRCTSGTVPSNLQTSAPVLLAPADATALLGTGATPGAKFMTLFQFTVRLSNVVATAEPGPGRSFAGSTSGGIGSSDRAAELAVMRLVLGGARRRQLRRRPGRCAGEPAAGGPVTGADAGRRAPGPGRWGRRRRGCS